MCPTCTNGVIFKTDANWSKDPGRDKSSDTVWFNLIDFQAFEGAVLSARVEFYRPSGSIKFLGVGMRFYRTEATGWTGHV